MSRLSAPCHTSLPASPGTPASVSFCHHEPNADSTRSSELSRWAFDQQSAVERQTTKPPLARIGALERAPAWSWRPGLPAPQLGNRAGRWPTWPHGPDAPLFCSGSGVCRKDRGGSPFPGNATSAGLQRTVAVEWETALRHAWRFGGGAVQGLTAGPGGPHAHGHNPLACNLREPSD